MNSRWPRCVRRSLERIPIYRGARKQEAAVPVNGGFLASNGAEQPKLGQGGNSIIETNLLEDLAILELEDGGAREVHLPARIGGQAANKEVLESGPVWVPPPSHWPTT